MIGVGKQTSLVLMETVHILVASGQLPVTLLNGSSLQSLHSDWSQQPVCHGAQGLPNLQEWTRDHVQEQHSPPGPFQVLISNGSNHAIEVRPAKVPLCFLCLHACLCKLVHTLHNNRMQRLHKHFCT